MWFHLWILQILLFYLPFDIEELEDLEELIDFEEFTDFEALTTWFLTEIIDFFELTEDF